MSVTVAVNGTNTLAHKGSNGIAKCTIPDVCKTPSPGGPVPIPYPVIISMTSDLSGGTTTVKADGGNMAGIKGCELTKCNGDEAGTAGGVKSSTNMKEAKFLLYSFDVKLDGQNACRLGDKMTMNHENTMCLGGLWQLLTVPAPGLEQKLQDIATDCHNKIEKQEAAKPKSKQAKCRKKGVYKHKCCADAINDAKKGPPPDPDFKNVEPELQRGATCRLDVAVMDNSGKMKRIYDFKFNCPPRKPKMSRSQARKYRKAFKCDIWVIGP